MCNLLGEIKGSIIIKNLKYDSFFENVKWFISGMVQNIISKDFLKVHRSSVESQYLLYGHLLAHFQWLRMLTTYNNWCRS